MRPWVPPSPTKIKLKKMEARHQWLTPVILATREAEMKRITVRSQSRAINSVRPYLKNT
jgi:hypothetical protein